MFDTKTQTMLQSQLDCVTNFNTDPDAGNELFFVYSFTDSTNNYIQFKVYFGCEKND